jgi:glycerol-3-phosphate dehydrogenase (NAD(P)+)
MSKVAVIGAGAWGTALSLQAVRAGHRVALIARDESVASAMEATRENQRLPGYRLPDALEVGHVFPEDADLLLWVVPTQHLRSSLLRLQPKGGAIVVCAKGVEAETHLLPLEVASEVSPARPLAVLTGPNFAHEVARGLPAAALVVRAGDVELPICRAVADLLAGVKTLDQAITQLLSRPQRDE